MPFNYIAKGWPSPITLNGNSYIAKSARNDDDTLIYEQAGVENPHISCHKCNKEGPDDWKKVGDFHVVIGGGVKFEYLGGQPADFSTQAKKKKNRVQMTGVGSLAQTTTARTMAKDFIAAVDAKIRGA